MESCISSGQKVQPTWSVFRRIHEADVADVFAAFDIDRDNIISEKDMASIMKKDKEAIDPAHFLVFLCPRTISTKYINLL